MIKTRIDDDEPDVIDLTASYGFYGSFNYPIRPPSPFADRPIQPYMLFECNEDNDINAMVTWSSSTRQPSVNESNGLSSPRSSSNRHNKWRRTLSKLLKTTKSNKHKKVTSPTTSDVTHPYDFGTGELDQIDSVVKRTPNKRVHWVDDDEIILNTCHRFVEYLKLFVRSILNDKNDMDHYLKHCQILLDELESLIDCHRIKQAFNDIIELAEKQETNQLYEQQLYIENLISRTILFSSA